MVSRVGNTMRANHPPDRTCLEQKIRGEAAKDKKGKNGNERVACSCRRQSRFIEHVNP